MDASTPASASTTDGNSLPVGHALVSKAGIIIIAAYLVLLSYLMLYVLLKIWPRSSPAGSSPASAPAATSAPASSVSNQTETKSSENAKPASDSVTPSIKETKPSVTGGATGEAASNCDAEAIRVSLFWGLWKPWIWGETRLLLIVILAGMFGSLVHAIRSFYWYVGNRALRWSWAIMYLLLPLGGGLLAMLFYFVVRGGFFSSQSTIKETSPFAFAAFSGLVGMFSSQAVEKLKQIAGTVFAPAEQGKDHVGGTPAPKIVSVSPDSGPATGATTITIAGSDFVAGAKVSLGGAPAPTTSVTSTSIVATTPPHAAGKVDVQIVNPDNQAVSRSGGFTYT